MLSHKPQYITSANMEARPAFWLCCHMNLNTSLQQTRRVFCFYFFQYITSYTLNSPYQGQTHRVNFVFTFFNTKKYRGLFYVLFCSTQHIKQDQCFNFLISHYLISIVSLNCQLAHVIHKSCTSELTSDLQMFLRQSISWKGTHFYCCAQYLEHSRRSSETRSTFRLKMSSHSFKKHFPKSCYVEVRDKSVSL